ncbi:AMP-binding protein [Pseudenhygromyxa sp. WMMC2535]|uniref:class I adenylate-forming enzyme family protein n=1 Tax=Pseudenhygromyxa sp. WMMC2535 TaxID=2712867 RepID=UPI0015530FA2|nr:AMP-binding protein [Pseudenhygromyxa sp. WMMC2535]NVB43380.1 AMP-binding protein [Pseudenhygromyxa sp. WMMC2535]
MSRELTAQLFAALEEGSEQIAYDFEGQTLTWAELDARARSYANAMAHAGVSRGDRVAVYAHTCLEQIVCLFGNYYLGAVHVPINTRYRALEVSHILADCLPTAVVGDAAGAEVLESALARPEFERAPVRVAIDEGAPGFAFAELLAGEPGEYLRPRDEDLALLIYTSGTTGPSKGVMLTHQAVIANIRALTGLWTWSKRDRLALALPLFHVHGLCIGVHGAALHAMTVLLERRFDAGAIVERFADQPRGNATIFMGVPTMYTALVEHMHQAPEAAPQLSRGRLFTSGSAALSADLWREFVALTDRRILERYGMSETLITLSNPYVGVRTPGAVGQPVPGCDAAVVDEQGDELPHGEPGELIVLSNGIMSGYWNRSPEQLAELFLRDRDGRLWFKTGDVATVDDEGVFRIVGRASVDIIKSGGFKISAREIEEVLATHPTVREVAVIGVADPKWGERIVACLVPEPSAAAELEPAALLEALVAHHRDHLADYKKPRALLIVDELPRNALGKLQKHKLRERVAEQGVSVG